MGKGDTSLIRILSPTKWMFDLYTDHDGNAESGKSSNASCPFFATNTIKFDFGTIRTSFPRQSDDMLEIDFSTICHYELLTFGKVYIALSEFIHKLEELIYRNTDYIYFDVPVKRNMYEVDGLCFRCEKKEICDSIKTSFKDFGMNSSGKATCAVQFRREDVKKALAVYNGTEKNEGGFNMKNGLLSNMGLEFGIVKDPHIRCGLTGLVVQDPNTGKWYGYDPNTHTCTDMLGMKFGNFPIAIVPTTTLGPNLYKFYGKYYWIQEVTADNKYFIGINAFTHTVDKVMIPNSIIPNFNFYSQVIAFDAKTLTANGSNQSIAGNLVGAMLISKMCGSDDAEFSLDDIEDDSLGGLGQYLKLMMLTGQAGIDKNNMALMLGLMDKKGEMNDIVSISLLSGLLGGGNTANTQNASQANNPFGNIMNTFTSAFGGTAPATPVTPVNNGAPADEEFQYECQLCHKKYAFPVRFCSKCRGRVLEIKTAPANTAKCWNCGADLDEDSNYCNDCGAPIVKWCPKCGKKYSGEDNYCSKDRADLVDAIAYEALQKGDASTAATVPAGNDTVTPTNSSKNAGRKRRTSGAGTKVPDGDTTSTTT